MCPVAPPPPSYRQRRRDRKHIVAVLATFAAKRPLGCPRWHRRLVSQAWRLLAHSPIVWSKQGVPCCAQLAGFYTELCTNTRKPRQNTRMPRPLHAACTPRAPCVPGCQGPPRRPHSPPPFLPLALLPATRHPPNAAHAPPAPPAGLWRVLSSVMLFRADSEHATGPPCTPPKRPQRRPFPYPCRPQPPQPMRALLSLNTHCHRSNLAQPPLACGRAPTNTTPTEHTQNTCNVPEHVLI
mgnify:CR=1 FL=1